MTFVFPVAFITTVPAQTITGREPLVAIWAAPLVGAITLLAAARFWQHRPQPLHQRLKLNPQLVPSPAPEPHPTSLPSVAP